MTNEQLKNVLTATDSDALQHQERAWRSLRRELLSPHVEVSASEARSSWPFSWVTASALAAVVGAVLIGMMSQAPSQTQTAYIKAEQPGIAATTFYSEKAQAEVIWLSGLESQTPKSKQ